MNDSNPPTNNRNAATGQFKAAFAKKPSHDLVGHLRAALAKAGVDQRMLADPQLGLALTNVIHLGMFQEKLGPVVRIRLLEATLREVLQYATPHLPAATLTRARATLAGASTELRGSVLNDLDAIRGDR
jgi:hypothetical protein